MVRTSVVGIGLLTLMWVLLLAPSAWAQDAGIAGLVRDNTGAVLPGVIVTAAIGGMNAAKTVCEIRIEK